MSETAHRVSRRGVLKGTIAGLAGLAALRALLPWRSPSPDWDRLVGAIVTMRPAEARVMARIAPVMLPVEGTPLTPRAQVDLLGNIDRQVARLPSAPRGQLHQALLALDYGAVAVGGAATRLVNLDDAAIAAMLDGFSRGSELQRAAFGAVKQLVMLGYFGDPATFAPLHYDGPVTGPRGIARLGNTPLPVDPSQPSGTPG